ncbi:transcriptional regulator family: Fungal Specific TF [Trichoderma aggressivum f. europaeum]|uniref:Transcriptional regulator family: Fungal Specific TF n=1 Tax=Trichoderma aggressivum f. europaeum TaxID=173218 RepID=A0AAE1IKP4_9HYPO|nr:transcriptional regulator family: Fungal Specific TF [Trichoderma aggressivum f. europaeum]
MRAEVICLGYRNLLDLNFQDQSNDVIRNYKAPARKKRHVPTRVVKSQASVSTGVPVDPADHGPLCSDKTALIIPTATLVYSVEEIARSYLYVNYMTGGSRCSYMSYLLPLMENSQNSAVNAAVNAVALAALSNIRLSPNTMLKAQKEYTTALSKTNLALKDSVLCKTDGILAAVVMLGIFEVMTCSDGSFIDRWVHHMEGATRLIEIRGSEQLSRKEGLDLFTQLRAQVSLSRIYQERYSSSVFNKLTEKVQRDQNPNDQILDQLATIVTRLTDLCANVTNRHIVSPTEIIRTALKLDSELVSLMVGVPRLLRYGIVNIPMFDGKPITKAVWGDSYHIYQSIPASSMWNNYRSIRIIIQELIINTLKNLEDSESDDIGLSQRSSLASQASQTALQLVEDICASVPYNLDIGIEDDTDLKGSALKATHTSISHGLDMMSTLSLFRASGAGGLTTMWPLLVAANSGFACDELRKWIANCLDKIGHSMGINQALAMSKLIQDGVRSRAFLTPEYRSHPYKL